MRTARAVCRIVAAHRGFNPRVFGSALRGEDGLASDLDLLIDPANGMTLFDMAAIAAEVEQLTQIKVDLKTPDDLTGGRQPALDNARNLRPSAHRPGSGCRAA